MYLDELGEIEQLPLGVALMALTTIDEARTPEVARSLLEQSRQQESQEERRAIIEMLTTILVYKFTDLGRREAEAMLGISLEETRFYREAKEDGREEEGQSLVLRQLNRRVGTLPKSLSSQIATLSLAQIEALAEALLDFQSIADLETWLENLPK